MSILISRVRMSWNLIYSAEGYEHK
jgi:hypothetical protein